MRLATIRLGGRETAGIVTKEGILPIQALNEAKGMDWKTQLFDLIDSGELADLTDWYNGSGKAAVESLDEAIPFEPIGCECELPYCYNGHAFLTLGCIPQLQTPTYTQTRDRETIDGGHWLQPEMAAFMSGKLQDNNQTYNGIGRCTIGVKRKILRLRQKLGEQQLYQLLHRIKERFK
jgi:hypothetical protein